MKTKRKEFIKRSHESACTDWKRQIEKEFPKLFPKSKLEVRKWYKLTDQRSTIEVLVYYESGDGVMDCKGYGFKDNKWIKKQKAWTFDSDPEDWTPATYKEVSDALIKEAKKRGFKKGCSYIGVRYGENETSIDEINVWRGGDQIVMGRDYVFLNGKWATIIESKKEMTVAELEKELGYEIKIVK